MKPNWKSGTFIYHGKPFSKMPVKELWTGSEEEWQALLKKETEYAGAVLLAQLHGLPLIPGKPVPVPIKSSNDDPLVQHFQRLNGPCLQRTPSLHRCSGGCGSWLTSEQFRLWNEPEFGKGVFMCDACASKKHLRAFLLPIPRKNAHRIWAVTEMN